MYDNPGPTMPMSRPPSSVVARGQQPPQQQQQGGYPPHQQPPQQQQQPQQQYRPPQQQQQQQQYRPQQYPPPQQQHYNPQQQQRQPFHPQPQQPPQHQQYRPSGPPIQKFANPQQPQQPPQQMGGPPQQQYRPAGPPIQKYAQPQMQQAPQQPPQQMGGPPQQQYRPPGPPIQKYAQPQSPTYASPAPYGNTPSFTSEDLSTSMTSSTMYDNPGPAMPVKKTQEPAVSRGSGKKRSSKNNNRPSSDQPQYFPTYQPATPAPYDKGDEGSVDLGGREGVGEGGYTSEDEGDVVVEMNPGRNKICILVALALLHIAIGLSCIALQIMSMVWRSSASYVASGIWSGVFFVITGITGLVAVLPFSLKALKVFMYFSLVTFPFIIAMICGAMASMIIDDVRLRNNPDRSKWNLYNGLMLGFGLLEIIIAILSMVTSCKCGVLFCGKQCCTGGGGDVKKEEEEKD